MGARTAAVRTTLVASLLAMLLGITTGIDPVQAQPPATASDAPTSNDVRYVDHLFDLDPDVERVQIVDPATSPDFAGNYIISEDFDGIDQRLSGASSSIPLDELRSNYGQPWNVIAGSIEVGDPDGAGPLDPVAGTAGPESARAWAPTGGVSLAHQWGGVKNNPLTLSATIDAGGDGARLLFGVHEQQPGRAFYLELDPSLDQLVLGEIGGTGATVVHSGVPLADSGPIDVSVALTSTSDWYQGTLRSNVSVATSLDGSATPAWTVPLGTLFGDPNIAEPLLSARTGVGFELPAGSTIDDVRVVDPLVAKIRFPDEAVPPDDRAVYLAVHHGASQIGTEEDVDLVLDDFARRGYVAVAVDYRTRMNLIGHAWSSLAANSHRLVVAQAGGTFDLVLDRVWDLGAPLTVQGLPVDADAAGVEGALNAALAGAGSTVRVDAWRPVDSPDGAIWLSWYAPGRLPYPDVCAAATPPPGQPHACDGSGGTFAEAFDTFGDQLDASPLCVAPSNRQWLEPPGQVSGPLCLWRHFIDLHYCPTVEGGSFPGTSEECDRAFLLFARVFSDGPALSDLQTYVRWLRHTEANGNPYRIDPDRIFASGLSVGGHLSYDLASDPDLPELPRHDPNNPRPGTAYPSFSQHIAGAAPLAGGWRLVSDGHPTPDAAPIAHFQYDVDSVAYQGVLHRHTRSLMTEAWALGQDVEYSGFCGVGKGVSLSEQSNAVSDEVARFFFSVMEPDSVLAQRGGTLRGGLGQRFTGTDVPSHRQQLHGTAADADPRDYEVLVGDFDGDGTDDLYWHDPLSAPYRCDSLWLGGPTGAFRTTPLLDETNTMLPPGSSLTPPELGVEVNAYIRAPLDAEPRVGDFNGDGRDDILWFHPTGSAHELWQLLDPDPDDDVAALETGTGARSGEPVLPTNLFTETIVDAGAVYDAAVVVDATGAPAGTDRNGDDLYLLDQQGPGPGVEGDDRLLAFGADTSSGAEATATPVPIELGAGFVQGATPVRPSVGDFDGDGWQDIFWYVPGSGEPPGGGDAFWYGAATSPFTQRVPSPLTLSFQEVLVGDFGDVDSGCATCDDLYLYDVTDPILLGFDYLWYGHPRPASVPGGWTPQDQYLLWRGADPGCPSAPDPARTRHAIGDFDADGWDDILWYRVGDDPDEVFYGRPNPSASHDPWGRSAFDRVPMRIDGLLTPYAGNFDGQPGDDVHFVAADPSEVEATVLFADDLDGTPGTALAAHAPQARCFGYGWLRESPDRDFAIVGSPSGGAAQPLGAGSRVGIVSGRATDFVLEADVDGDGGEWSTIFLRVASEATWVALRWRATDDGDGAVALIESVDGQQTVLATSSTVLGTAPARLWIEVRGDAVAVEADVAGTGRAPLVSGVLAQPAATAGSWFIVIASPAAPGVGTTIDDVVLRGRS